MLLLLCVALFGCSSQKSTNAKVRRAYAAGQQAAMAQIQQQQMQQPGDQQVRIIGAVKNSLLTWSQDLTLARALAEAEYLSPSTPKNIIIYRGNQNFRIDPQTVLQGQDYNLFPGDTVQIQE